MNPLVALRAVVTFDLVAALAQPVLAGLFLTGDVPAIEIHARVATGLGIGELVMIAVAAVYVLRGRGRVWVLLAAVGLFAATALQIAAGYTRLLQLHVPLGVAIVTATVVLAIWVWSPAAARTRVPR